MRYVYSVWLVRIILMLCGTYWACSENPVNLAKPGNLSTTQSGRKKLNKKMRRPLLRRRLSETELKNSYLQFVNSGYEEICFLDEGIVWLKTRTDNSVELNIYLSGKFSSASSRHYKSCSQNIAVPWDQDNPLKDDFEWMHKIEHNSSRFSKAVRSSCLSTVPNIVETWLNKTDIADRKLLFPLPANADPPFRTIRGTTNILRKSVVSFQKIAIFAYGEYQYQAYDAKEYITQWGIGVKPGKSS